MQVKTIQTFNDLVLGQCQRRDQGNRKQKVPSSSHINHEDYIWAFFAVSVSKTVLSKANHEPVTVNHRWIRKKEDDFYF